MRSAPLLLCLVPYLPCQQAPQAPPSVSAATRARLAEALTKSAATADTAFELRWGNEPAKGQRRGLAQLLGAASRGAVSGSWHAGAVHLRFENEQEDQLVVAAGRMIARDSEREWCLRQGRFADGNPASSRPDPQSLLAQLGGWPLALTRRSAGSFEDRPVEVVSVTLTADQTAELLWSGALPQGLKSAGGMMGQAIQLNLVAGGAGAPRPAATAPDLTLDLAISLDPGTNTIFEIRGKAWAEKNRNGNVFVFRGGAVAVQVGAEADDEDEDEDEDERPAQDPGAPLRYADGLPVRDSEELTSVPFRLVLRDHGRAPAPELPAAAARLLR
ncbi:MAG: hypothetical protein ACON4Z_00710 [Planctomycetota bacterium]